MLGKLKQMLFPCEVQIKRLMSEHDTAVRLNETAHKRLLEVCQGANCKIQPPQKGVSK